MFWGLTDKLEPNLCGWCLHGDHQLKGEACLWCDCIARSEEDVARLEQELDKQMGAP